MPAIIAAVLLRLLVQGRVAALAPCQSAGCRRLDRVSIARLRINAGDGRPETYCCDLSSLLRSKLLCTPQIAMCLTGTSEYPSSATATSLNAYMVMQEVQKLDATAGRTDTGTLGPGGPYAEPGPHSALSCILSCDSFSLHSSLDMDIWGLRPAVVTCGQQNKKHPSCQLAWLVRWSSCLHVPASHLQPAGLHV